MKCDHCDNEATVHEVTLRGGVPMERNFCESCAAKHGLAAQSSSISAELLKSMIQPSAPGLLISVPAPVPAQRGTACPTCKMTFAEFKSVGQLGCPDCYEAFESQLAPMLERAHEGAGAHIGKKPKHAQKDIGAPAKARKPLPAKGDVHARAERVRLVRKQLDEAVKAEQYELAAKLRDQLKRLTESQESE
jgi:protein arginine kinase activator